MVNPISLIKLEQEPNKVGIVQQHLRLTRGQLLRRGAFVAERLAAVASSPGCVILSLDSSPDFVAGLLGCWLAGKVPVLLDPLIRREIDIVARDTGARVMIRGGTDLPELPRDVLQLAVDDRECAPLLPPERDERDPVVYLFTSGSTGRPTLVPKTVDQLLVEVDFLSMLFERPQRVATFAPWCHIYGFLVSLLMPLSVGGLCDLSAGISPKNLLQRAREGLIDLVVAVPAVYHVILRYLAAGDGAPLPSHCRFVSSGAPLPPELRTRFTELTGCQITDLYGSTEAGGVAYRHDNGPWRVQPHVEARRTEEGFLEVKSRSVSMPGEDGFYRIGDLVTFEKGGFRLQGRADDVVKIGGRRTSLGEILEVIESMPEVAHASVLAKKIRGVLRPVAYVELNPQVRVQPEAIKAFVRRRLADHKVPRIVEILESLPRTGAGKVDRQKLLKLKTEGD